MVEATSGAARFALVVVAWNSAPELATLFDSVDRELGTGAPEVVVVDNGSTDDSRSVAERRQSTRVVGLDRAGGFGAAANVGVREASAPVVVVLNPDTILVDDSITDLAGLAARVRALVGPEILNPDGSRQPSASARPAGWEVALSALAPAAALPASLAERCEPWRSRSRRSVGWLTGACIAAPRDLLLRLGPFDERLPLYGEDMDLGLRAARAGIPSIFAPDVARVIHIGGHAARRRFDDAGQARKLAARRQVVAAHAGTLRERYDHAAQVAFHASRCAAKRALRRDASAEGAWLRAARASR